jgi:polyhydroxyalkanoate synthesis regulator phasin
MKTNNTQENLKKYLYTGIGHISHAGNIVRKSAKELALPAKVTEADGKKIVDNAIWEIEKKYNEAVHKLASFTSAEVAMLQNSFGKMEKQVVIKNKKVEAPVKHMVKKSAPKRSSMNRRAPHVA